MTMIETKVGSRHPDSHREAVGSRSWAVGNISVDQNALTPFVSRLTAIVLCLVKTTTKK